MWIIFLGILVFLIILIVLSGPLPNEFDKDL